MSLLLIGKSMSKFKGAVECNPPMCLEKENRNVSERCHLPYSPPHFRLLPPSQRLAPSASCVPLSSMDFLLTFSVPVCITK